MTMTTPTLITANVSFEMDGQPGQIKISALDFETVVRRIHTFDLESKTGATVTGFTLDDGRQFEFNSLIAHHWLDNGRMDEKEFIEMMLINNNINPS